MSAITTALPVQRRAGLSQKRFLPERTRGTHADTSPDKTNLNPQLPQSATDELAECTRRAADPPPATGCGPRC